MFDLCKLLGVEEGEVFKLNGFEYKIVSNQMYHFDKLRSETMWTKVSYSLNLLAEAEFERIPFVPKLGEKAWTVSLIGNCLEAVEYQLNDDLISPFRLELGIYYRTKEQAEQYGIPKVQALRDKLKNELGCE